MKKALSSLYPNASYPPTAICMSTMLEISQLPHPAPVNPTWPPACMEPHNTTLLSHTEHNLRTT